MAAERIDIATAREMWRLGDTVIDVRLPEEYRGGHVPGAVNIPIDTVPGALDRLPPGQLITTCTYGRRAQRAAEMLAAMGRDAFAISGGTKAWQAAGLPLAFGDQPGEPSVRATRGLGRRR